MIDLKITAKCSGLNEKRVRLGVSCVKLVTLLANDEYWFNLLIGSFRKLFDKLNESFDKLVTVEPNVTLWVWTIQ